MDDLQGFAEQTMVHQSDPSMMMQPEEPPMQMEPPQNDGFFNFEDEYEHQPTLVDAATGKVDENMTMNAKVQYEIKQDSDLIQMETFVIPGSNKTDEKKANYKWPFGHSDGHMAVILGHNTIFKQIKTGKDPETGAELKKSWRVCRLENRYRPKNFPFVSIIYQIILIILYFF